MTKRVLSVVVLVRGLGQPIRSRFVQKSIVTALVAARYEGETARITPIEM